MMQQEFDIELPEIIRVFKSGGVLLYPTDTIWGLGCDATNEKAVAKIFEIKNRPQEKSMIILVDRPEMIQKYVREIPEIAWEIIENTDKPITLILEGAINLPANLINEDGSIAIRVTNEPLCKQIIHKTQKALVSTSANISGAPSPAFFNEISPDLINKVDYTVNYRRNENIKKTPSSIIKLKRNGEIKIIRK